MESTIKGTWIVNSNKHLLDIRSNTPELSYFEATSLAGKSGTLLARLTSDEEEIISRNRIRVFARESGISFGELRPCLDLLKSKGKVDYTVDGEGKVKAVEVYCFSTKDVLETTSHIYDDLDPSENEEASVAVLDKTFHLPLTESEILEKLTAAGFDEKASRLTLKLQRNLGLVRADTLQDELLYFNEYAFAGKHEKIARALKGLKRDERGAVETIQQLIEENPGYPLDTLARKFPAEILKLMEGVGLLDGITVQSEVGDATFVMLPQMKGMSIDAPILSADVFHKAKVLLSCLRFGEVKSSSWRGRIRSHEMMINIINKLVRGEWVGPCTAIGQDYQLLEKDGVIKTRPNLNGMCDMKLRQKEVGVLVKKLIEYKRLFPETDIEVQRILATQPTAYKAPESRRTEVLARTTKGVKEIRERLMESLREGTR